MAKTKSEKMYRTFRITKETGEELENFEQEHDELKIGLFVDDAIRERIKKYATLHI
jgi:hypothetical protein